MDDRKRMLDGKLYNPMNVHDGCWEASRKALEEFNKDPYRQIEGRMEHLRKVFGCLPEDAWITPPFYCDKGSQIYVGKNFYANTGLLILDEARVEIGDNVFIAPRVSMYTACHPIDAAVRNTGLEYAKGITIGNNVWIGGNVVINPGVHIGNDVVIGSGSVVTKDIEDHVIAAGNPCKVIRAIGEEDSRYWNKQLEDYRRQCPQE